MKLWTKGFCAYGEMFQGAENDGTKPGECLKNESLAACSAFCISVFARLAEDWIALAASASFKACLSCCSAAKAFAFGIKGNRN